MRKEFFLDEYSFLSLFSPCFSCKGPQTMNFYALFGECNISSINKRRLGSVNWILFFFLRDFFETFLWFFWDFLMMFWDFLMIYLKFSYNFLKNFEIFYKFSWECSNFLRKFYESFKILIFMQYLIKLILIFWKVLWIIFEIFIANS